MTTQAENKAIQYVEKYGITDYTIVRNTLVYYANYPKYLTNKRYSIRVCVDLTTGEETRNVCSRWTAKGNRNLYK